MKKMLGGCGKWKVSKYACVQRRSRCADTLQGSGQPGPAQGCRSAQAGVKMEMAKGLSLRGPEGAVAISQYQVGMWESHRRNRSCLPEIATAPSGPRNDKSGAITVLSSTCAGCRCGAGTGCPLPCNGRWRKKLPLRGVVTEHAADGEYSQTPCGNRRSCRRREPRAKYSAVPSTSRTAASPAAT